MTLDMPWSRTSSVCRIRSWSAILRVRHPPGAQPYDEHLDIRRGAAPGLAWGRAVPGRRDATRASACKIIGDHVTLMIVRTLYGHKTHPEQPPKTTEDHPLQSRKPQIIDAIHKEPQRWPVNPWIWGRRSLGRRSSTSRWWCQWRLTASLRDGASATIDTTNATSKAARTRESGEVGTWLGSL